MTGLEQARWNFFAKMYIKDVEAFAIKEIFPKFKLATVNLDWSPKRRSSRGGMYADGPGINMAMNHLCKERDGSVYRVYEYKSFDSDPLIGGFYTRDKHDRLRMVIVHEIAHALQYYSYKLNKFRCKPHGPAWKNLYKRLREEFINSRLEDQTELKRDYEEMIKKTESKNTFEKRITQTLQRAASK